MVLLSIMLIAILTVFGLAFGSFVNALVWRLHQQSLSKKKRIASDAELSISRGRSMCPHCKHMLAWYDLLPVISWLSLGGRCRYCKESIGWQYPLVELLTAVLFVVSYIFWPYQLSTINYQILFIAWLVALVGFVALIVYDLRWMLLPNKIVFPLTGLGVFSVLLRAMDSDKPWQVIALSLGGLMVAGGIFYIIFQVSNGSWIGGGDVKLGFALGLFLGSPVLALLMLFFASLLGLAVAIPGIITKKSKLSSKLPFGPFLISATIIVMLFGNRILDWYFGAFLYL